MASPERRLSAAPNYLLWLQLSLTKLKLKHLLRARLATLPIKILLSVTLRGRSSEILYRYFIKEEKKKDSKSLSNIADKWQSLNFGPKFYMASFFAFGS